MRLQLVCLLSSSVMSAATVPLTPTTQSSLLEHKSNDSLTKHLSDGTENTKLIVIMLVINLVQFGCFAYALYRIKLAIAELAAFVTQKSDDGISMRFRALQRDESRLDGTQITSVAKNSIVSNSAHQSTKRHFSEYEGVSDEVYVIEDSGSHYSPFDGHRTNSVPDDYGSAKECMSSGCIDTEDKSM